MLRRLRLALTWVFIVAVGYMGSVLYTSARKDQTPILARVELYEGEWKNALEHVKTTLPLSQEAFLTKAPVWQRGKLRPKLAALDNEYQPEYNRRAERLVEELRNDFVALWDEALENFADTPSVEKLVQEFHPAHQERYQLRKVLTELDRAAGEAPPAHGPRH